MPQYRPEYQKTHTTAAATSTIFTGRGVLHSVTVNTIAAGTVTLLDGGVAFAVLSATAGPGTFTYDVTIANTLTITTAAASDLTVSWAGY